GLTPVEVPDLREVFLGDWEEGEFRRRAAQRDPIFEQIFIQERWDVIPGSEPHDDFDERVWRGFQRIVAAHPDERVVAVSHGGVMESRSAIQRYCGSASINAHARSAASSRFVPPSSAVVQRSSASRTPPKPCTEMTMSMLARNARRHNESAGSYRCDGTCHRR